VTPLGFRDVWLTASTIILSRPDLITVVVILYVNDVMQSTGLFRVAVSLSHTTSWGTGIVRRVSYKDRTGCVVHRACIARTEPEAPSTDAIVIAVIPYHYAILPAHDNSGAITLIPNLPILITAQFATRQLAPLQVMADNMRLGK
jgi:hypothetical protein